MTNEPAAEAAANFAENGFCLTPTLIPDELLRRVMPHMDAVMLGNCETGVRPIGWQPGDDPNKIRKMDQAHLSDNTLFELVTHPAIGRWAAAVTGARMVQIWALQMLYKPPGGGVASHVGWHQDQQYWTYWEEGSELFTAWIALSDVTAEAGPMRFVRGSHRWGFLNSGDYFSGQHDLQREQIQVPEGESWEEVPALLAPGEVSFHHRLTYHGSGPNLSPTPRRSIAIHLRTEKSQPVAGATDYYVSQLDNPRTCPVIYRGEGK